MRRSCKRLHRVLPHVLDGELPVGADDRAHLASCLRCHAELARYRRLARLLAQLRAEQATLPPGLVRDVVASVEHRARRGARYPGRLVVMATGAVASVALASVVLLARTGRATRRTARV